MALFQQFQEMKESQTQLQERLRVAEGFRPPPKRTQSRSRSRTVRERFSKTPVPNEDRPQTGSEDENIPELITTSRQNRFIRKTTKMEDPVPLRNGISPTFDLWHVGILDKFAVNYNYFADDESKCAYIYNKITKNAQQHLFPR